MLLEFGDRELAREGCRERRGFDPVELLAHLGLCLSQVCLADPADLQEVARDPERVALPPALELAFRPILAQIASRVADEAVGACLDELGPASCADPLDDVAGCGAHGLH